MATLAQLETFVFGDAAFKMSKFRAARFQAALDIFSEASPAAPRVTWRDKIVRDPMADLDREYHRFIAHPSIQGTSGTLQGAVADATVLSVTKGLVDTFAAMT